MEMRLISSLKFPEMTDLITKSFHINQGFEEKNVEQLLIRHTIPNGSGTSKRFDEYDTETYAKNMEEGENASKASVGHGYHKTMYLKRRGIEIDITKIMRMTGKEAEVKSKITSLSHYCPERRELDLTHSFFTFANATSYTDQDGQTIDVSGGDDLAPAYSAHTLKHSSSTWRNRISGDPIFSTGALEAGELLAATNILNNFGNTRNVKFNVIFSGKDPNTVRNIRKTLLSTGDVDEVNPNILNTYTGWRQVVLPNLATDANGAYDSTKRRWWGILATEAWQAHFGVWEENHMNTPFIDPHNDNYTYGARESNGRCLVSARGSIYSLPTS